MMPASLPLPKQHGPLQLAGEQFVASMEKTSRENLEASLQKLLQHAERRVDSQLKDAEIKIVEVQKVKQSPFPREGCRINQILTLFTNSSPKLQIDQVHLLYISRWSFKVTNGMVSFLLWVL
ncbi:uncharacterized protein [Triticum aestivum]|uniref:uncharacterized protein isoform X2 n=1 Tax=Triticum aestivum TaxID=4565 RepID=UPI001D0095A2|nr:uncharacterized protein LOC123131546 isoform X2 [Triticum aestivum]